MSSENSRQQRTLLKRLFPYIESRSIASAAFLWFLLVVIASWAWLVAGPTANSSPASAGAFVIVVAGTINALWTFFSPTARAVKPPRWVKLFRTQASFQATLGGAALLLAYQVMDYAVIMESADPGTVWLNQEATGAGLVGLFHLFAGAVIPVLNTHIALEEQNDAVT